MAKTATVEPSAPMADTGTEWLNALEEKVRTAGERLRGLREENTALHRRIEELEERLAAAATPGEAERWVEERQAIRGRVERLVEHLEGLLE